MPSISASPIPVCFVGTDNTCRSFMAEFVARDWVKNNGCADKFVISSRGLEVQKEKASPGPRPEAIEALKNAGVIGKRAEGNFSKVKAHVPTSIKESPRRSRIPPYDEIPASMEGGKPAAPTYYFSFTQADVDKLNKEYLNGSSEDSLLSGSGVVNSLLSNKEIPDFSDGSPEKYQECIDTLKVWVPYVLKELAEGRTF